MAGNAAGLVLSRFGQAVAAAGPVTTRLGLIVCPGWI